MPAPPAQGQEGAPGRRGPERGDCPGAGSGDGMGPGSGYGSPGEGAIAPEGGSASPS